MALPEGPHPIPSRTRKLSPPGPMVLQSYLCGRVGRCRNLFRKPRSGQLERGFFVLKTRAAIAAARVSEDPHADSACVSTAGTHPQSGPSIVYPHPSTLALGVPRAGAEKGPCEGREQALAARPFARPAALKDLCTLGGWVRPSPCTRLRRSRSRCWLFALAMVAAISFSRPSSGWGVAPARLVSVPAPAPAHARTVAAHAR